MAKLEKIKNETLYDGEWGTSYDSKEKVMLGGYSLDGETFSPEFKITGIDSEDVPKAIAICSRLYNDYGTIVMPFSNLLKMQKTTELQENRQPSIDDIVEAIKASFKRLFPSPEVDKILDSMITVDKQKITIELPS